MKTGLVTFYHIHHYGALLQAAATERAVESLGHECEIIDYFVNQDNSLFRRPTGLGSAAADAHTALHYPALQARYQRFEKFSQDHLRISPRRYESLEELRTTNPPYDAILAGSDQIWNPLIFPDGRFDPVFFGAFSEKRKIAYAPSFGTPVIPEGMEEELRKYLSQFSHLSVREKQGQKITAEITGREAPVVLDPTLLLTADQWRAAIHTPGGYLNVKKYTPGGYILCYCISKPGALAPYIRTFAERSGMPIVQLCGVRQKVHPKARCVLDAGPAEFLELFANAAFVFTNSFHGTVFSVQFHVPFFTAVSPRELADPETSRTFSILSRLGLTDRIIGGGSTAGLEDQIDWQAVDGRLAAERAGSLDYLRAALENAPYESAPAETRDAKQDGPRLADHSRCTGCTACASVCPKDAIAMVRDQEGFSYPAADLDKCVRCGRCTAACPALKQRPRAPLPAAFAAWNRNDEIRRDSTSGGVFTALADYVLESGGVVFGAAMDGKQRLRHVACFRKEDLWRLRGAKYVQSDLGETFREVRAALNMGRDVLFSGTPCQVDGLYSFLGCRPEKLTTCDLVCHGVPSPGVWEDMARSIEAQKGKGLQAVRFRNKVTGWKDSHFTTIYDDGTVDTAPLFSTEYGRAFGRSLFLRPSCHRCAYTNLNRPGDFTLGDFWGLKPEELPEQQQKGVSLLLVNTAHGSHIFDQLPLSRQAFPVERAVAGNPRLASPIAPAPDRTAFFAAYALEPFGQVRKRFFRLPPLPVRAAGKVLSPEIKAKIRAKLR
ncbi:polysaccharide pyruvyl transferase family protein [uncultured Dysosmobacter sp.]|uniref:polysaccharide pyruvyl transferase family protein n=1 Tax=uncultured Dysosmobacter sp. TaxID=2591384 RepID=UPI00260D70B9|nr:polysaccharide pyruvyl transferase family protein [uncultured Dysosmobacter sp.]